MAKTEAIKAPGRWAGTYRGQAQGEGGISWLRG